MVASAPLRRPRCLSLYAGSLAVPLDIASGRGHRRSFLSSSDRDLRPDHKGMRLGAGWDDGRDAARTGYGGSVGVDRPAIP